jgi:hypothetical protein
MTMDFFSERTSKILIKSQKIAPFTTKGASSSKTRLILPINPLFFKLKELLKIPMPLLYG